MLARAVLAAEKLGGGSFRQAVRGGLAWVEDWHRDKCGAFAQFICMQAHK
jgi:hypothetical protein